MSGCEKPKLRKLRRRNYHNLNRGLPENPETMDDDIVEALDSPHSAPGSPGKTPDKLTEVSESSEDCLMEIAFLAACNEFQIRMVHLSSECNRLSDHLSRWDLDISHRQKFFDLVKGQTVTESIVSQDLFHLTHTW